ncbi:MAG: hypothetical protein ABW199_00895 [Caulobacterales bacterium]
MSAGVILLCIGFPLALALSALALGPHGPPPLVPMLVGGPFVLAGWAACSYAANRFEKARDVEGAPPAPRPPPLAG